MGHRDLFFVQELSPDRDGSVQQRFPCVVKLVALFVLAVVRALGALQCGSRRQLDRVERGQRQEGVQVLHENTDALDFIFSEHDCYAAEVLIEAEDAGAVLSDRVRSQQALTLARLAPTRPIDALASLRPAALFEGVVAPDAFVLAPNARALTIASGRSL